MFGIVVFYHFDFLVLAEPFARTSSGGKKKHGGVKESHRKGTAWAVALPIATFLATAAHKSHRAAAIKLP